MLAVRMIPAMWLRLVVIVGFCVFMLVEGHWMIAAIAAGLAVLTVSQLLFAYRQKAADEGQKNSDSSS